MNETHQKIQGREKRWLAFFSADEIGKEILACIKDANRVGGWDSAASVAQKIAAVYSPAADVAHVTAWGIHEGKSRAISMSADISIQTFNAMSCIAYQLTLTIARPLNDRDAVIESDQT